MTEKKWNTQHFRTITTQVSMSNSSLKIEQEREDIMDKLKSYHADMCDPKTRFRESHKITIKWMIARNVTKLRTLPLPKHPPLVNSQIELCEQLFSFLDPDQEESLRRHIHRLRRQLSDVGEPSASRWKVYLVYFITRSSMSFHVWPSLLFKSACIYFTFWNL